jgi:hypothetical protein
MSHLKEATTRRVALLQPRELRTQRNPLRRKSQSKSPNMLRK